jgi:hypothetical protein
MHTLLLRCLIGLALLCGLLGSAPAVTVQAEHGAPPSALQANQPQAAAWILTLDVSTSAPGFYLAEARLVDGAGQPATAAPIAFYEQTTFGRLLLETAKTNKQGYASTEAKIPNRTLNLVAVYCVSAQSCPVETTGQLQVEVKDNGVPFWSRPADLNTPYAPPIPIALMLLTLMGLWGAFGFVVYQIVRIKRSAVKTSARR